MVIIYTLIGVMVVFKVYDKLTRKYVNPYKTVLYYGKKGCGKTTYLTKVAINAIREGKTVYSNVMIPGTILFNPKQLKTCTPQPNSIVLIDEIGLIWDNRNFKSFESEINEWFKYARQYRVTVHMFSQVPDIDLKIRNLCDAYYLMENKARVFSYGKRISKVLTVKTDIEGKGNLVDSFEFAPLLSPKSRTLTFIPRWSEFYQSFNPPTRPYIKGIEMPMNQNQIDSMNNHKLFVLKTKCKSLLSFVKERFEKIVNGFIKWIMKLCGMFHLRKYKN